MEHHLTKSNNNNTIAVQKGDVVVIELEETPTTGYTWQWADGSSGLLQLQSSNFELGSTAMGGGGKRKFTFIAVGDGNAAINLKNQRSWSGEVADSFSVRLQPA